MSARDKVKFFLDKLFEIEENVDSILRVEEYPLYPGGIRVFDRNGEFVYWYDFLKNEIVEIDHLGTERQRIPWFVIAEEDPNNYYPGGF